MDDVDTTRVAAVIVLYHPELDHLRRVLQAHRACGPDALIVVDNGSRGSAEIDTLLEAERPGVGWRLVRNAQNQGLGRALNQGIEAAAAMGCTHVALFDQDSLPAPDLLQRLLAAQAELVAAGHRPAAVGPTQRDSRTGVEYPQRRIEGLAMRMIWPSRQPERLVEVSFLITSGSLVSLEVLQEVGPMRDDFFVDYIDIEWCFRAGAAGLRCWCVGDALLHHTLGERRRRFLGREISVHSATRSYFQFRNLVYMARMKTVPMRFRVLETLYFLSRAPVHVALAGLSWHHVRQVLRGIADGWRGRLGPGRV